MKLRSTMDVFLLILAMVLLVIVGYGIISRNNQPAVAAATTASNSGAASDTVNTEQSLGGGLGLSDSASQPLGSSDSSETALGGDQSATLEQIDAPTESSQSWDLVNGNFAIVRATMNVNVRVGPGLDYAVIRSIPRNTEVQVVRLSPSREWIRVLLSDGTEGWIFGQLLEIRQ
ncbi:MAG: SH3 domain-containing protein [Anaerolineae bacterium]